MKAGVYRVYCKDLSWYRLIKVFPDGSSMLHYSNDKKTKIRTIHPDKFALMIDGWKLQDLFMEKIA